MCVVSTLHREGNGSAGRTYCPQLESRRKDCSSQTPPFVRTGRHLVHGTYVMFHQEASHPAKITMPHGARTSNQLLPSRDKLTRKKNEATASRQRVLQRLDCDGNNNDKKAADSSPLFNSLDYCCDEQLRVATEARSSSCSSSSQPSMRHRSASAMRRQMSAFLWSGMLASATVASCRKRQHSHIQPTNGANTKAFRDGVTTKGDVGVNTAYGQDPDRCDRAWWHRTALTSNEGTNPCMPTAQHLGFLPNPSLPALS